MNLLLSVGDWFAQNWMLILLIVIAILLLVPTYFRNKKEVNARNELNNQIVKGTKVITTAGIYGVVESVENTTDGKVVTIVTGNEKHPTTMSIHINAIGGIDNKSTIVEENQELTNVLEDKTPEVEQTTDVEEEKVEKKPTKKSTSSTSKKTTKK